MSANLSGFDASQVPEQHEFSALPEGKYVAVITASEMKPNAKGTGEYLQLTMEVIDGPRKGAKLWARLNLVNPNPTAVEIARVELGAICRAVGVIKPNDSAELHNKPLLVSVKVVLNDKKKEVNEIEKYESAIQQGQVAASGGVAQNAPAANAAPWSAPAAATPAPWAK